MSQIRPRTTTVADGSHPANLGSCVQSFSLRSLRSLRLNREGIKSQTTQRTQREHRFNHGLLRTGKSALRWEYQEVLLHLLHPHGIFRVTRPRPPWYKHSRGELWPAATLSNNPKLPRERWPFSTDGASCRCSKSAR